MKKNNLFPLVLSLVFVFVIAGCGNNNNQVNDKEKELPPDSVIGLLPTEVVETYMKHTLGSIPGAEIDYDEAKKYLSDELRQQFTSSMFVPVSYCIQDGPDNVRIASDKPVASSIEVVVEGQYGGEWQKMWQFSLVSDNNLSWLIKEIKCLSD